MQTLNAYLQSTQTLNQQVPEVDLAFYVSKAKLMADLKKSSDAKKKVQATIAKEDNQDAFIKIDVKLEPLRADISYSLRQKHYTEAVRALVNALD